MIFIPATRIRFPTGWFIIDIEQGWSTRVSSIGLGALHVTSTDGYQ